MPRTQSLCASLKEGRRPVDQDRHSPTLHPERQRYENCCCPGFVNKAHLYPPTSLLDAVNKHFSDKRITPLRIEHCVKQVDLRPVQLEICLDEGGPIFVNRVNVCYSLFLGYSGRDQSADLRGAG